MASEISAELLLEIKGFIDGLKKSQGAADKFGKSGGASASSFGKSFGGIGKVFANIAAAASKAAAVIGAAFAAIGTVVASKFLKGAIDSAADFEQLTVSMNTFTGSAEKTKAILDEVAQFGVVTPFETSGLENTVKNFLAAGIAVEDVTALMKETAAVAKDTAQVEELGDALSKGFAKGKFQTEELNKFLERGINLMPTLAAVTGKSGEALQKAIEKGLKFDDVREAIAMMSREGGQFYGMLDKQSRTTNGLISTLKGSFEEFQRRFGAPMNDALKPILEQAIAFSETLISKASRWGETFVSVLGMIGALIRAAVQVFSAMPASEIASLFGVTLRLGIANAINFLSRAGSATFAGLIAYFIEGFKNSVAFLSILTTRDFWAGMLSALLGIAQVFAAFMLKRISQVITAIKSATGKVGEKLFGDSDKTLADQGDTLNGLSKDNFSKAGVDLAPAFDKMGERMRATGAAVGEAVQNAFKNSTNLFDTSGDEATLKGVANQIAGVALELRGNKPTKAETGTAGGGGNSGGEGGGVADSGLPKLNSRLAGALNTIAGRSANAVIAAEAAKTSQNTERTAKAAEEIARNTANIGNGGKPQPKPAPSGGKFA